MYRSFIQAPKRLFIAAALAGLGAVALAQGASPASAPEASAPAKSAAAAHPQRQHPRLSPEQWHARMAEQHAKHLADLKAALSLTPDQASAWTQFETAMQPPAPPQQPPQPGEWAKLTTPERIDRMEQRANERQQHFKQVGDAVKAFYAQLTPAQQKTFDQHSAHFGPHGKHGPFGPHGKPGNGAAARHPGHAASHPAAQKPAPAASQAN